MPTAKSQSPSSRLCVFDFDGTLTTCDTLLAFIIFCWGKWRFATGFLRFFPLLLLMKLHLYPNGKAKERVFTWFFRGMTIERFDELCRQFAAENRHLLRPEGVKTLQQALVDGAEVAIVSASIDNWVGAFFTISHWPLDISQEPIAILGTQVEVVDSKLTGRFLTKNCYGQEKVNRLLERFPHREDYHLTAYGDSRGDREMLAFADEAHYKPFRV
jgi:HAD superfamily phosphoserine phosphatase-like hydrolase